MTDIVCFYCAKGHAMKEAGLGTLALRIERATVTVHDKRGCYHLCWAHAEWRKTTSWIGGHSSDCAVAKEKRS